MGPHRRVHCGGSAERCLCKEALCIGSSAKTDFSRPDPKILKKFLTVSGYIKIKTSGFLKGLRPVCRIQWLTNQGRSKKGGERRFEEIEDEGML